MNLLVFSIALTLISLSMIGFFMVREARILKTYRNLKRDIHLALRGTSESIWTWHLESQEFNQIGFDVLVDGNYPKSFNAIEFINQFIHPEDLTKFNQAIYSLINLEAETFQIDYRLKNKKKGWIWISTRGSVVEHDSNGKVIRIAGASKDVTANRYQDYANRVAYEVFKSMSEAVAVLDLDFKIMSINAAFSKITGYSETDIIGKNISLLNSDQYSKEFYIEINKQLFSSGHWSGEAWEKRKDFGEFLASVEVSEVLDNTGNRTNFVMVVSDITDKKRIEQELIQLANYDSLTGLPSRGMLIEKLGKAIIHARRSQQRVALLFLDLDNFKYINDSLGHTTGDRLLVVVAQRLLAATRNIGLVARLSGDEFVVLIETVESDQQIHDCAQRVVSQFHTSISLSDNQSTNLTTSVGVSIFPDHAQTPSELLKFADIAMYQAKSEGRNTVQYFNEEMDAKARHRAQLLSALKMALSRDELELNFQPRLNLDTQQIVSVEALLRWNSKEFGRIAPDVFIPLAEESGQIIEIGDWVLQEAMQTIHHWHAIGLNHMSMSINVSPLQLMRATLSGYIGELLQKYELPDYCIELEITESMVLSQQAQPLANLWALKNLGVSLSLDDFGTGYSSLSYLKQLPIDTLKIDKSFIREIGTNANDNTLVKTIIALGHSLGMTMIAEGVETEAHLEMLKQFGCDEIQGYLLAHPMTAYDCLHFINDHQQRYYAIKPAPLDADINAD